jgi:hypothetical protein
LLDARHDAAQVHANLVELDAQAAELVLQVEV